MKYLVDEALIVESVISEEMNEATGAKEKNYYIEGVFSTPGQKNRNGRIYPLSLWEREVSKYQNEIKNNTMNTLGEWEHPSRTSIDPLQAVMKIVDLKMDNGLVVGKAKILNNNSEKTNQLKALIDEGMKIGVSSRGTGTVKGDIVENFSLTCYDCVSAPSDYNANLTGLCESLEKSVIVDDLYEAINSKNWTNVKEFMRKQPGFNSWEFEGDYETLIIGYKTPKQAAQAFSNSNKSSNELMAYGDDFWVQGKKIYVVLSDEAKKALDVNESIQTKKELTLEEKKIAAETFMSKFSEILGNKINEGIKVNSPMSCVQVVLMAMKKITDEKTKDLLQSAVDYLAKEYKIELK